MGPVDATELGGDDGEWTAVPGVYPGAAEVGRGRADSPTTYRKDGREWRIGTNADVAWIEEATAPGLKISSAIPPVFAGGRRGRDEETRRPTRSRRRRSRGRLG